VKRYLILISVLIFLALTVSCTQAAGVEGQELPAEATVTASIDATSTAGTAGEDVEADGSAVGAPEIDCELELPAQTDWPLLLCETFADNRNQWQVESQDNPYARYTSDIKSGQFQVEYNAKFFSNTSSSALTWFDVGEAKDFVLSVRGLIDTRLTSTGWGVAFRADDEMKSFFLFSIYNDGSYALDIYENQGWGPLIGRRPNNSILPGQVNKLVILVEGQDFTFWINDQQVNRFEGGLLEESGIRLVVTAREGAKARFAFDDVVLQAALSPG